MGIRGALSKNGERLIAYRVGCSPRNLHNLHNLHRVGFGTVRDSFTLIADSDIKALTEALPGESFETTAFTTPPPLADATVAIVTSASLHHPDQDDFEVMDTGYRVLDGSRRDYVTGHWSPNFDGSGFAYDMNTVFPVDRLDELAERGVIGRVADQHLAYAGNQFDLSAREQPCRVPWLHPLLDSEVGYSTLHREPIRISRRDNHASWDQRC